MKVIAALLMLCSLSTIVISDETAGYAELTGGSASFTDQTRAKVSVSASGHIRTLYTDVDLVPVEWMSIQANGETSPSPAFVIDVKELSSQSAGYVPRTYNINEILDSPSELIRSATPTVVLRGIQPGTPTDPPVLRKMKRTRINVA